MDMNKEREAFEAWLFDEFPNATEFPIVFYPDEGKYNHVPTQARWEAWQAAKAESHNSASLYQWEINHLASANQQLRDYAAKASAVPDDYVIVPKEPTEVMVKAGQEKLWLDVSSVYKAMIEAAQDQS